MSEFNQSNAVPRQDANRHAIGLMYSKKILSQHILILLCSSKNYFNIQVHFSDKCDRFQIELRLCLVNNLLEN